MTNDFSTISAANKTLSLITTVEIPATIAEISTRPHCTQCNALYSTSKQCHVMSTCCDTAVILRQLFWNLQMLSLAAWRMQHVSPKDFRLKLRSLLPDLYGRTSRSTLTRGYLVWPGAPFTLSLGHHHHERQVAVDPQQHCSVVRHHVFTVTSSRIIHGSWNK